MGKEIRRVPPNWEHPRKDNGDFQVMFDKNFDEAKTEYHKNHTLWKEGKHPDQKIIGNTDQDWDEWDSEPDQKYYHSFNKKDATWYQVYETVSEGTPVTPPFKTKEEIINYLVIHGDFWDQGARGKGGWGREAAKKFVESEWALSGVFINGEIKTARDGI